MEDQILTVMNTMVEREYYSAVYALLESMICILC